MKRPRRLRSELILAFWIFGALLVVVIGLVVVAASLEQEDTTFARQLSFEMEEYYRNHSAALEAGEPLPPVISRFVSAYVGTGDLPDDIREWAGSLPEGTHALDPIRGGEDYFVSVRSLEGRPERLYLVFDTRRMNEWVEYERSSLLVLAIGGSAVLLLGFLAARRLSGRVLRPVAELESTVVENPEPGALARELESRPVPEELASLKSALESSMRRIGGFIDRERAFTRNASHELRTPVAVLKSTTELLERERDPDRIVELTARARRAVEQMQELIETFLWLAREESDAALSLRTDLAAVTREIVRHHQPLLEGRDVDLELEVEPAEPIVAPPQAVGVAISNLVKNACESTRSGRIQVRVSERRVEVVNTGALPTRARDPERSRGFGLVIVRELCDRFDWSASIGPAGENGVIATLEFPAG